jgi:outer membrane protein assembly factor BamB
MPVPDLPRGPGPSWRAKLGASIHAPAAIRDGIAYVGTSGGMFYAVNLANGGFVWPFAAGRPIYGEALATEAHVYFVCDNGFLFKLDRKTGKEVWRYDVGDAQSPRVLPHQVVPNSGDFDFDDRAPRPVIADGVIYIGAGDGSVHAVDAESGHRVWRVTGRGKIRTTAAVDGPRVIVGSFDNSVYALDRHTGAEVWKRDTRGPVTSAPVLVGEKRDTLIVGNRNGVLAALDPATGEIRWRMFFWGSSVESEAVPGEGSLFYVGSSDLRRVSLIDSRDGQVLGRTDVFGWAWPRPLVTDRFVYASAAGASPYEIRHLGGLSALDRRSGAIVWRWPMPEWPGSWLNGFTASPATDGRTLVVGGLDGTLYAFPIE